ncbi:MAG: prepilin peptidase [Lachnospiraceae bacterium]|nr:prepilin peptidase [Lachnospiraceae bacterium]
MTVQRILAFVLLLVCSYTDIRKRTVDLRFILGMTAVSVVLKVRTGDNIAAVIITYAIILSGMLFISRASRGGFGEGDAYIIASLGAVLGGEAAFFVLLAGLIPAAGAGLGMYFVGHRDISETIVFVPYLFLGFIILLGMELI